MNRCITLFAVAILSVSSNVVGEEVDKELWNDPLVHSLNDPHGVIDFRAPAKQGFAEMRPVKIGGYDVKFTQGRFSWQLKPGVHDLQCAALLSSGNNLGLMPSRGSRTHKSSGDVTIEIESGKRYFLAAELTDNKGGWKPVIWKEEDM